MKPSSTVKNAQRFGGRILSSRSAALVLLLLAGVAPLAPRVGAQQKADPAKPVQKQKVRLQQLEFEEREGPEFLRRRQQWFFHPRTYPIGFIPAGAREKALAQMRQMQEQQRFAQGAQVVSGGQVVPPPSGTGSAWMPIGPQATSSPFFSPFTSGRVTALAVDPCDAAGNTVFLGGADGGIWKTTEGGTTWTPLFDFQPLVSVGSIALDPTAHACASSVVYVGTGEDNFGGDNIYGVGVFKSADGGATWTQDSTFHTPQPLADDRLGPFIGALAVNRAAGKNNILLAAVRGRALALPSGIWCSSDSGSTWTHVLPLNPINGTFDVGTDVVFASDGTAIAALGFPFGNTDNGIYKSSAAVTSCTITWNKQTLPSGTPASSLGRIALAIAPSDDKTIYAAIADSTTFSSNLLGVIKTTNGGTTWTKLTASLVTSTNGFCNAQCFYDLTIAVHPTDPLTVFAGGAANNATVIRSLDGGTSWTEISRSDVRGFTDGLHVDTHAFAFAKTGATTFTLYVGNDGGVWNTGINDPKGTVGAGFWKNLNAPLNITQFYPGVSIHPSTPLFAMGGTQDNGTQVFTGSLTWQDAGLACDGGFTAIDNQIPSTTYGECEYIPNPNGLLIIAVSFSGDGQLENGFLATTGITSTDRGDFIPPLVIDKNNSQRLYFGTFRLWQTVDGANTWSAISGDLTVGAASCPITEACVLKAIAAAPSDSSVVYTGADDGTISVSTNVGAGTTATFTKISNSTLPGRSVTQVAVDPLVSKRAFVVFSGFGSCATFCDGKGHVFITQDATLGAATVWTDITGNLPDIPVNDIVIDPDDLLHNTIYLATDVGAFFSTTGGFTWSPLGAPSTLPNSEILSLVLHNPSRTLRAATHGRGMWDLQLGPLPTSPALRVASISPFKANVGDLGPTTLTVKGTGFTGASTVSFNGSTRTPTFMDPQTLTLPLTTADFSAGVAAPVFVQDGANASNTVVFTVLNPIPGITANSLSPASVTAGTANFSLTINGSNFVCGVNGTIALFNLSPRTKITACTPGLSSSITVLLPDSDLTLANTIPIDVFSPQPGGGPDTNPTPPNLTINAAPGADFSLTPQAPTSATVAAGKSVNYTVALGETGGFNSNITLSCSLPAANTTCGVSPASQKPLNNVTVTVTTTARALLPPVRPGPRIGPWLRTVPLAFVAILLLFLLTHFSRARKLRLACALPLAGILLFLAFQVVGCGGGSSPPPIGTPVGTFTVTVTGTSGGATHTATVSLIVN